MRKNMLRLLVVALAALGLGLPAQSSSAARPAPASAAIELIQSTDTELGTPTLEATYAWSGFHGRLVAHVSIVQNGVSVLDLMSMPAAGRGNDLSVAVPIQPTTAGATNAFYATGYLTNRGVVVSGSEQTTATENWQVEAVPCDPAP